MEFFNFKAALYKLFGATTLAGLYPSCLKTHPGLDNQLLKRIIDVQQMNAEDKNHILYTLDALIKSVKLKSIA